jgi:hypothetical protein
VNHAITDMLKQADGRYLTKDEGQLLREFASSLEARLAAMEELSQKEGKIIDRAIKEVMRAYPDYKDKYPEGQQKGTRDMTFVLRYCAHAMVRNDARFLEDTVLAWACERTSSPTRTGRSRSSPSKSCRRPRPSSSARGFRWPPRPSRRRRVARTD